MYWWGGINCLPDTAFDRWKRQRIYFIKQVKKAGLSCDYIVFTGGKATAEQAMYVLEHFAKDMLAVMIMRAVYAVHTDKRHMHGQ